jgi:hypothetical protein
MCPPIATFYCGIPTWSKKPCNQNQSASSSSSSNREIHNLRHIHDPLKLAFTANQNILPAGYNITAARDVSGVVHFYTPA